jgi:penicillin-binding protein 1B
VAIGAYDATPLDMAGAYTIFANNGLHLDPWLLASVRTSTGDIITDFTPTSKQVLDPRVAYLTTSLMEDVLRGRNRRRVRSMGFSAPAAGKTGTSHDAWFAGYTSNLLCIVWVGNDDYTDVKIEGAHAAAPIWAEFMKRAVRLPQYSDTNNFSAPGGIEVVSLDKVTNLLSDDSCPDSYDAAFLERHRAHGNLRPPSGAVFSRQMWDTERAPQPDFTQNQKHELCTWDHWVSRTSGN